MTLSGSFVFCEVDGKVAVRGPEMASWSEPEVTVSTWVSTVPVRDWQWWVGVRSHAMTGNAIHFYKEGRYTTAYTDDGTWTVQHETKAVKPPGRGSKNFRWAWSSGKWRKEYL